MTCVEAVEFIKEFLEALAAVSRHPLAVLGWLALAATLITVFARRRKLAVILRDLESLPPGERRYKLEREYKILLGAERKPLAFVRRKKKRLGWVAATVAGLILGAIAGGSVEQVVRARAASLVLEVVSVTPERYGYLWRLHLYNPGAETVTVNDLTLRVRSRTPHPAKNHLRPKYPDTPRPDYPIVALSPQTGSLPVMRPEQELALGSGETRTVVFDLEADHPPHQGWIYEVALELRWRVAGQMLERALTSGTYRLGWPGLPHWSEPGASGGPASAPVVDPVTVAGR